MPVRSGNEGKLYRIGTWNVKSLRNEEYELTQEMERYNLDVLGLSEMKVRVNGMKVIDGTRYVHVGVSESRARGRVGKAIAE